MEKKTDIQAKKYASFVDGEFYMAESRIEEMVQFLVSTRLLTERMTRGLTNEERAYSKIDDLSWAISNVTESISKALNEFRGEMNAGEAQIQRRDWETYNKDEEV